MEPQPTDHSLPRTGKSVAEAARADASRRMRWLLSWRQTARFSLGLAVTLPLLGGALLLVQAWCLATLLGSVAAGEMAMTQAYPWIAGVVALLMIRAVLAWAGERAASLAAGRIKQALRLVLFDQILARGPQWTRAQASGRLSTAVLDLVDAMEGYFSRYIPSMVAAVVLPLAFGLAVLPVHWVAGLLLLVTAPLIPLFMALVGWGAESASRLHQQAISRLSALFADRLRGILTLRLFGRAQAEVSTVRRASKELRYKTLAVLRIAFLSSAVLEFFAALGVAGVAVIIGLGYLGFLGETAAAFSLKAGLFCLFLAPEVYLPLRQMAANYHDRANARAAVAELESLLDDLPALKNDADSEDPSDQKVKTVFPPVVDPVTGEFDTIGVKECADGMPDTADRPGFSVTWQQVSVAAVQQSRFVIRNFSLHVPAGHHVALMGHSGVGKTTLIETALGLRDLAQGQVLVNGRPVSTDRPLGIHDGVVLIGQTPFFFAGSIAENLGMGQKQFDYDVLWGALRLAQAEAFVRALPQGLDTPMASQGHGFSGGQLQRLALARLFLTDPGLILLDEPTAHLDVDTRDAVMRSVLHFAQGRTLIVVTHDEDVAALCRQTVVLPAAQWGDAWAE